MKNSVEIKASFSIKRLLTSKECDILAVNSSINNITTHQNNLLTHIKYARKKLEQRNL